MKCDGKHIGVAADCIIELNGEGIVFVKRKYPPLGLAIPGGFVDYGESLKTAAIREAKEEVGLTIDPNNTVHLGTYSEPDRDPRGHVISGVFVATDVKGTPKAGDDAKEYVIIKFEDLDNIKKELVFDHAQIITDYQVCKRTLSIMSSD